MLSNQYTTNYKGYELHFAVVKYFDDYWTVEARDVDGYCFNIIGTSNYHEENSDASEGCFWSHLGLGKETSELIDHLIMDGVIRPTGRIVEGYGKPYYVEMQQVDRWMDNLYVEDHTRVLKRDEITTSYRCTCARRFRSAEFIHNDHEWAVIQNLPFLDRDDGRRSYYIEIKNTKHPFEDAKRSGFSTNHHRSITDAWLEAMRLERAMDEILDCFERVADKQNVSVELLMDAFNICEAFNIYEG